MRVCTSVYVYKHAVCVQTCTMCVCESVCKHAQCAHVHNVCANVRLCADTPCVYKRVCRCAVCVNVQARTVCVSAGVCAQPLVLETPRLRSPGPGAALGSESCVLESHVLPPVWVFPWEFGVSFCSL